MEIVSGFSKLSKKDKIAWITSQVKEHDKTEFENLDLYWHQDASVQKLIDEFSENTISNYIFPFGVAPNFLINEDIYTIPLVIEESSVVAACSKSAKFWLTRGGFKTKVLSTVKKGQIHFIWNGSQKKLKHFFSLVKSDLLFAVKDIVRNMEKRGGGVTDLSLVDKTSSLSGYYQLDVKFETCDAMGANFINTVLEAMADELDKLAAEHFPKDRTNSLEIIMSILSNYTPECLVQAYVECPITELGVVEGMNCEDFAKRFERAVQISKIDVNRAVTHNKGIFNGIDAIILATGNDFRAIEACGHAYAARDGLYRGLSHCSIKDGVFRFELTLPLALGTIGGLTKLHPLSKLSLKLLGTPNAKELMQIVASVGLAQNFGAVRSLVTTGIQKGHMKMHLLNILNQLNATTAEVKAAKEFFKTNTVSYTSVRDFLLNHTKHLH